MSVKALQEYTIYSRYARYLTDKKRRETWAEQVERVFQMHEKKFAKELENEEFRKYFEIAKDAVLKRKVLGSQRALQFGGEPIERHNEKIYNCSVTYIDRPRAFQEVMFLLLCGCGVGFSVQNIHVNKLPELRAINLGKDTATYKIPDSIEGWSEAIGILINSYFNNGLYPQYENRRVEFDYSLIRPEGSYISGGFKAPGPAGLERSIEKIRKIMEIASTEGKRLRPIHAYDILMHSSDAVLSGGVRRSATICLFSPDDEEMAKAKTGNWFIENAQRGRSNNSALLVRGKTNKADFMRLMESVKEFGEPGFVWAEDEGVCVNPCLSKDTIVFTSQGPRKIEDLIDLPFQALVNGKPFNSLKGFFKTGEQDLFVLKTKEGFEVELTKNHKVLLSSGEWVEAGQLSIGDKITIHQHNNEWSGFGNENEGWLVGSLLGDGCFSNGSAYLDYWGEAREEMMDIALDYIRENNLNYDTRTRGGEAVARVGKKRVQCKKLGELALEVGINEDKTISDSIYKTSSDFIKGFLGGWFDADGSVQGDLEKGISVRLSSAKLENLKVAQKLLLYFGIYSRVYSNRSEKQFRLMPDGKGGKKEYPCQALHELVIANDSILQFQNLIKFREKEKAIKLYELINSYKRMPNKTKFIGTFESLTYLKTDSVYDCTVEDIHAFDANGLYVHNCVEIGMYPVLLTDKEEFSGVQFCNLCEINGKKCKDLDSFLEACEAAAILGTMQAAYTDFPYLGEVTEDIVRKESLLGCSITGMMDNPVVLFNEENQRAGAKLIRDTNKKIASLLNINPAARTTCVKPAGCQKPDSLISTQEGILRLDEIGSTSGETWQDHDFNVYTDRKIQKSTKFFINGKSETKKILLDSGLELESTKNHQYRIIDKNGEYIWKRADELSIGDIVPYSLGEYNGGEEQKLHSIQYNWNKNTPKYIVKDILQPNVLDEDLAWFLGFYYGDGSNHLRSIRISGNSLEQKGFDKCLDIVKNKFGIDGKINQDRREGNRCYLSFNSKPLITFLRANGLLKEKAKDLTIPKIIRCSKKSVISSFVDGFATADGCDKSDRGLSFCTISKEFAEQLVIVLRAIGRDCKMRLMPPTDSSFGTSMRYWVQERKGRNGEIKHIATYKKDYYNLLERLGFINFSVDKIINISDSFSETYDIEVPENNTYISNSYISHNTTSCVLGSSSGIHPHHAKRYFRRVQANRLEFPAQYFASKNPDAVEESVWSNNNTDVVLTFLCEVPVGGIVKNQVGAIDLLERVKLTQQNWVEYGTNKNLCVKPYLRHNVSNTITVKPEEWDEVANYIFENRKWFAGISLLPSSGDKDYPQAPFTTVYTASEIVKEYGEGSVFASGLIVDGLKAFDNNLWKACDFALGLRGNIELPAKPIEPDEPKKNGYTQKQYIDKLKKYANDLTEYSIKEAEYEVALEQINWIRRAKQFSDRYFEGDLRKATYCLKDVSNWKTWCDLKRTYVDIDWTEVVEEDEFFEEVSTMGAQACAGGSCEVSFN